MNLKNLSLILFSLALICTAVGAVFVYTSKADAARALARKADAEETIAREAARKAKAEEMAAASLAKAKESEAKTAEENRKAEEARLETEKAAESRAKLEAEKSRNDREKVAAEYEKAKALKDAETAKAVAATATSEKEKAEAAKAQATLLAESEKTEQQKIASAAVIAEAKVLELRKIDFETIERELLEFKAELDERERALHPDKTSADLQWVGEREAVVLGVDSNSLIRAKSKKKKNVLPENDPSLSPAERALAKEISKRKAAFALDRELSEKKYVLDLEKLYIEALKGNRKSDAEYYRKAIKSISPNWELKKEEKGKTEK
jgi:hypothetical protein